MIFLGVCVLFVAKKNRGRRRNEKGTDKGRWSGHKLYIIDGFTDGCWGDWIYNGRLICDFFFRGVCTVCCKEK